MTSWTARLDCALTYNAYGLVRKTKPKMSRFHPDENHRVRAPSADEVGEPDSWLESELATSDASSSTPLAWRRLWNRLLTMADEDARTEVSESSPRVTTDR